MVHGLGGPVDLIERLEAHLPHAPLVRPVPAPREGVVAGYDTRALGLAVVELGGGRTKPGERLDLRVGLADIAPVGTRLTSGDPVALVHAADEAAAARAAEHVLAALRLGERTEPTPVILGRVE